MAKFDVNPFAPSHYKGQNPLVKVFSETRTVPRSKTHFTELHISETYSDFRPKIILLAGVAADSYNYFLAAYSFP